MGLSDRLDFGVWLRSRYGQSLQTKQTGPGYSRERTGENESALSALIALMEQAMQTEQGSVIPLVTQTLYTNGALTEVPVAAKVKPQSAKTSLGTHSTL
jgi:hypothetical protein